MRLFKNVSELSDITETCICGKITTELFDGDWDSLDNSTQEVARGCPDCLTDGFLIDVLDNMYDIEIMEAVRQNLGLKPDDRILDYEINKMTKRAILNSVASWNNLVGYGDTIKSWIEKIYHISLTE